MYTPVRMMEAHDERSDIAGDGQGTLHAQTQKAVRVAVSVVSVTALLVGACMLMTNGTTGVGAVELENIYELPPLPPVESATLKTMYAQQAIDAARTIVSPKTLNKGIEWNWSELERQPVRGLLQPEFAAQDGLEAAEHAGVHITHAKQSSPPAAQGEGVPRQGEPENAEEPALGGAEEEPLGSLPGPEEEARDRDNSMPSAGHSAMGTFQAREGTMGTETRFSSESAAEEDESDTAEGAEEGAEDGTGAAMRAAWPSAAEPEPEPESEPAVQAGPDRIVEKALSRVRPLYLVAPAPGLARPLPAAYVGYGGTLPSNAYVSIAAPRAGYGGQGSLYKLVPVTDGEEEPQGKLWASVEEGEGGAGSTEEAEEEGAADGADLGAGGAGYGGWEREPEAASAPVAVSGGGGDADGEWEVGGTGGAVMVAPTEQAPLEDEQQELAAMGAGAGAGRGKAADEVELEPVRE